MIYAVLFWEFFKIGLFAIGGGLVTVPFLYDLADTYPWFNISELINMIAVSESTPGPIGVNMATYAGFKAAGIVGGIVATLGLVTPSVIIIILLAHYMHKNPQCDWLVSVLNVVRPIVLALIIGAGFVIAETVIVDVWRFGILVVVFIFVHFVKLSPIVFILLGAVGGIIFGV